MKQDGIHTCKEMPLTVRIRTSVIQFYAIDIHGSENLHRIFYCPYCGIKLQESPLPTSEGNNKMEG
jgi:hypothetical protein